MRLYDKNQIKLISLSTKRGTFGDGRWSESSLTRTTNEVARLNLLYFYFNFERFIVFT